MLIREITSNDNNELATLIRYNFEKYNLNIPGTVYFDSELDNLSEYYLAEPDKRRYYVIFDDSGNFLGGAGLAEFECFDKCAELQKLYLTEQAKGKGLGRQMVSKIEQTAKEMGYKRLYIETHTNFDVAVILYNKMGFKEIEKPPVVQHSAMNTFFMKELN